MEDQPLHPLIIVIDGRLLPREICKILPFPVQIVFFEKRIHSSPCCCLAVGNPQPPLLAMVDRCHMEPEQPTEVTMRMQEWTSVLSFALQRFGNY